MANQVLTNALGAFGRTTGSEVNFQVVVPFEASGAISANDLVAVAASVDTDTTITVETLDVSDSLPERVIGVAKAAAADGAVVEVVVFGYAICNIGDTAPALDDLVTLHASTDGAAAKVSPADATAVVGDHFGIYLGTEIGSSNTAAIWFSKF
jgi:hypothetical protein|tara:strand:+ start:2666 stop:3124 length:459 start_codon:yes stop_codon:yes gene_type:complete